MLPYVASCCDRKNSRKFIYIAGRKEQDIGKKIVSELCTRYAHTVIYPQAYGSLSDPQEIIPNQTAHGYEISQQSLPEQGFVGQSILESSFLN